MRLSNHAINIISQAAKHYFGSQVKIWLFGSRVDDNKRGGDIDLYIEVNEPITDKILKICRMDAEIQIALGEQKIDILITDSNSKVQRIHEIAKRTGVLL